MKIEILGTGCHNCLELELRLAGLVRELGLTGIEIQRVDNQRRIRGYMTPEAIPGLIIDGQLMSERQVPDRETLARWLSVALPLSKS